MIFCIQMDSNRSSLLVVSLFTYSVGCKRQKISPKTILYTLAFLFLDVFTIYKNFVLWYNVFVNFILR